MNCIIYYFFDNELHKTTADIANVYESDNNTYHNTYLIYEYNTTGCSIIHQPGEGLEINGQKYLIDNNGYLDLKSIKTAIYNDKIENAIDTLP